jgi:hypothetical protein
MSTVAVDIWGAVKIWIKNLTKVPNEFFIPNSGITYNTNEI